MNLLAKRGKWLALSTILVIWGCQEDLGIEVDLGQRRTESVLNQFNLPVTHVYFDSVRTDAIGRLLVGEYSNSITGSVTTESYTEYQYKDGIDSYEDFFIDKDSIDDIQFESALIRFRIAQAVANQASITQDWVIETLTDSIFSNALYLNDRTISTGVEIGRSNQSLTIENVDFSEDTVVVEVNLNPIEMSALFDDLITHETDHRPFGIKISGENSDGIFALTVDSDTTEIVLTFSANIYENVGDLSPRSDTTLTSTFSLSTARHFVNIERDFTGSSFDGITDKETLDPNISNIYYHPLMGIYPVFDLSEFISFAEDNENATFLANVGTFNLEFSDNLSTIPDVGLTRFYFANKSGSTATVNWSGALATKTSYATALLSDNSYAGSTTASLYSQTPDTLTTDPVVVGLNNEIAAFWQVLHQSVRDDLNAVTIEDRDFPNSLFYDVESLVLQPSNPRDLGMNTIPKEGISVKIIHTKIKN